MAEGGEKTELPTPKKLRDARQKGQVCVSKDVSSTAVMVVMLALTGVISMGITDDVGELLKFIGQKLSSKLPDWHEAGFMALVITLKYSFIFCCVAAAIGVMANVVQVGALFTFDPLKPNLNKLNPVEGAKKIFSMKNIFEFLKNVLKITFLGFLVYKIIVRSIPALLPLCYGSVQDVFTVLKAVLKDLASYSAFGYIVIAAVDWIFQQKNYTKQMMMTKDEVKREYKEMEGSQEVKQAQRDFRNELLNGPDPRSATKKANVIVTNPTHLAIGIRYDEEEAPVPKVVVAGADHIAKIIRETALAEGIPIMENVPLARALYAKAKVDQYIPVELVEPVAAVLKMVKNLEQARREQEELDAIQL